ncbi:hypothetical protein [Methylocystis bryophila]|uniref:Antifreeze protein n=1 Tax=Methylocystis bryophila TaxID=655015 RepID=A0A1W6MZL1_9HYPH|nr:hypothetical protein [Methylocystis bryophila]ARN83022.1 hypothetical protein B1812_20215 [Methylocystis bryophila]BDV39322.1 hypothetical protein DSM21852_25750 [Methylocystis bryophila]
MSMRTRLSIAAAGLITATVGVVALGVTTGAGNQALLMFERQHECGDRYEAAKVADTLNGQSWGEFFKVCHASLPAPTQVAEPAAPATATTAAAATADKANAAPTPMETPAKPAAAFLASPPAQKGAATAAAGPTSANKSATRPAHWKESKPSGKRTAPSATRVIPAPHGTSIGAHPTGV